ncbi:hypothetical protein NQZ68_034497 [Dissostichus eleginoides]|nr:hypothetical protein NQZ68_034497 [Dissostichus eleginoides]
MGKKRKLEKNIGSAKSWEKKFLSKGKSDKLCTDQEEKRKYLQITLSGNQHFDWLQSLNAEAVLSQQLRAY